MDSGERERSVGRAVSTTVLLNSRAGGGRGRNRWAAVEPMIPGPMSVIELDGDAVWSQRVAAAVDRGVKMFVAAGGDGTVNALLNALVDSRGGNPLAGFTLGAVGLGSSNDFHKPIGHTVAGVPVRLDARNGHPRDVGRVVYTDSTGATRTRYFIVSASVGFMATANDFFNRGDAVVRWLKTWWTSAAIVYAAIRTLAVHRNVEMCLDARATTVTNLSVQKTPFLAGAFRYDTPVAVDDGRFSVNLTTATTRRAMLRIVLGLWRGHFAGRTGCHFRAAAHLDVRAALPFALELDGEVTMALDAIFDLLPEQIVVCS